jgi:transcriptional regulator
MYNPPHFATQDLDLALQLMVQHPFAMLVGPDAQGGSFATHLPLTALQDEQGLFLEGHMARANPHWEWLAAQSASGQQVLAIFSGPSAYISPGHYDTKLAVPTWNYLAVHLYGELSLIDDEEAKDALLKRLIGQHEPAYAAQWRSLPRDYQSKMLGAIVGFRFSVQRWEGKIKLSQNRPAAERSRIQSAFAEGNPQQQALAGWMKQLGL